MVRNWSKFRHQLRARLTVLRGTAFAHTRRWRNTPTAGLLPALRGSNNAIGEARGVLIGQIAELRRRGLTWSEIGNALGVTRQAAWERFAEKD